MASDLLTWTLKMTPSKADEWDELVKRAAGAAGRRTGRSNGAVTRRDMVETLVELAQEDPAVFDKLVEKFKPKKDEE
ncbi:hypothetical protein [Nocardia sp. NPDC051832]|uniref:hypothetical protein n=1 Tax=Nocardia sp. NPDC051832 TaxID=3155673 RepID=UPI00343A816B